MKVKIIVIVAVIVAILVLRLRPIPLDSLINTKEEFIVSCIEIANAGRSNNTYEATFEPGTQQHDEILNILNRYTYHRTLRFWASGIKPGNFTIVLDLANANSENMILSYGGHEILICGKVYSVDYIGSSNGKQMAEDIKSIVEKECAVN